MGNLSLLFLINLKSNNTMADSKTPLEPGNFYHIYNHAVGKEKMFKTKTNYLYFIDRLEYYLHGYVDIYSYCLMPNHFHILIRVRDHKSILTAILNEDPPMNLKSGIVIPHIISRRFSHLFNSYAQAFNKENQRKGSLFYNRFKRKTVTTDQYLKTIIIYIHNNPVISGYYNRAGDWPHSSYRELTSNDQTFLMRQEVIELFGDVENFKFCHLEETAEPYEGY
jgi:REP element-mobilizing transposase RayT